MTQWEMIAGLQRVLEWIYSAYRAIRVEAIPPMSAHYSHIYMLIVLIYWWLAQRLLINWLALVVDVIVRSNEKLFMIEEYT